MIPSFLLTSGIVPFSGPSGTITLDANEYSVGAHILTVNATDTNGNSAVAVIAFTTAAGT